MKMLNGEEFTPKYVKTDLVGVNEMSDGSVWYEQSPEGLIASVYDDDNKIAERWVVHVSLTASTLSSQLPGGQNA